VVSEARTIREAGARGRVEPSRECLLDHAAPGRSTETAPFTAATASRQNAWKRTPWSSMAKDKFSGCFDSALVPQADSRAAQHDKSEIFRQTETLPNINMGLNLLCFQ